MNSTIPYPISGDDTLDVTFYINAVPHEAKSLHEGRPIYEEKEYVKVVIPGTKNDGYNGPIRDDHKVRFSKQYQAFKAGLEAPVVGTPLDELISITVARRAELKAMNIRTIEQLAGVSDTVGPKLGMGWVNDRKTAIEYLSSAKGKGALSKMMEENKRLKQDIEMLQEQIKDVNAKYQEFLKQRT